MAFFVLSIKKKHTQKKTTHTHTHTHTKLGSIAPLFAVHVRRLAALPLAFARSVTRAEAERCMFASALFLSLAGGR